MPGSATDVSRGSLVRAARVHRPGPAIAASRRPGALACALSFTLLGCTTEGGRNGTADVLDEASDTAASDAPETANDAASDEAREEADGSGAGYGCWVEGPVTTLDSGVCGYASASAALGSVTVSGYFSEEHPFTCYLQARDADDEYDGGCDDAGMTGEGTQFLMNYECDGVQHSSGWLDTAEYDGWCGTERVITACEIRVRAPGC